jgi:hypothetical protein
MVRPSHARDHWTAAACLLAREGRGTSRAHGCWRWVGPPTVHSMTRSAQPGT